MFYRLFLDDERQPKNVTWVELPLGPWLVVKSYKDFVRAIEQFDLPDFVSFDHDLAEEHYRKSMYAADRHYNNYYTDGTFKEKTGYDCAKWLVEYCLSKKLPLPDYAVHTMNPVGRENIIAIMENGKRALISLLA